MAARVIQGLFVAGPPRPAPSAASALSWSHPPGPPAPAGAPNALIQARLANPGPSRGRPGGEAAAIDPARIGLRRTPGRPLPDGVRGQMEAALGADFSAVRVHVGPQAERLGAIAFTMGGDIYFAPGRYRPDTSRGQRNLLITCEAIRRG
jgi:hypothetical protein